MSKEWFASWFDTPFYHQLYSHRNYDEAQDFIDKLLSFLKLPKGSKVLDVGCGKGRHAMHIHSHEMEVVGIDLSAQSIAFANQSATDSLHFFVADMRDVFRTHEFDVVVNLFSSFGYFESDEEDKKALLAMRTALKKGGVLVLDYMNPEKIIKNMKAREIINRGDLQFHIQKKLEFPFIVKTIDFLADGVDYHFEERLKVIPPQTFRKSFEELGFTQFTLFGDYDLSPFDSKHSNRQIWVLQ